MPITTLKAAGPRIDGLAFKPDEVDRLKAKLLALTEATVIVRSPVRDEQGRCKYVEVPDTGIQLAATVKALEFAVGKPRQMMEVTTNTGRALPEPQNLTKLLAGNPDLVKSILTTLKESLENSQAVPVQALPSGTPPQLPESQSEGRQR